MEKGKSRSSFSSGLRAGNSATLATLMRDVPEAALARNRRVSEHGELANYNLAHSGPCRYVSQARQDRPGSCSLGSGVGRPASQSLPYAAHRPEILRSA